MAAPFGFSIGDFIAAINLSINIASALSTTSTSAARYRGLVSELYVLEKALIEVRNLRSDDQALPFSPEVETLHRASHFAASRCQATIDSLLINLKPYEGQLATNGKGNKWMKGWRKVRWVLLTEGEIEECRAEIRGHAASINMILTITHFEISKLQSRKAQENHTRIIDAIQQGYNNTMSTMTSALEELEIKSENLTKTTDAIVRSNSKIVHEVWQAQQIVSPPCGNSETKPVTFIDAYGKETHFYLNFVYSPTVLQNWLEERFKDHGYEKIVNREYAIEDLRTNRQLTLSRDWQTVYPGMYLGMDFVYSWVLKQNQIEDGSSCPGCQEKCVGDTNIHIICHNCGVQFKRTDELLEHSPNQMVEIDLHEENNKFQTTNPTEMDSETMKFCRLQKQFKNWYNRILIEKSQMQAFRRFRFQPTRAEFVLALKAPIFAMHTWSSHSDFQRGTGTYYHRMLRLLENGRLEDSPNRLYGLNNLALSLFYIEEFETAEKILQGLLDEVRGAPVLDLSLLTSVICNLAAINRSRNEKQVAKTMLMNAIHVANVSGLGERFPDCLSILRFGVANLFWTSGAYEDGLAMLGAVIKEISWHLHFGIWKAMREEYKFMLDYQKRNLLGGLEEG